MLVTKKSQSESLKNITILLEGKYRKFEESELSVK
jgi:hypothetical protein